jgi:hypothetical protein
MEYKAISDIAQSARVSQELANSTHALRRERLERLAALLDEHKGPVRLLARIEYLPASQRALLRATASPLTIAFQDPVFQAQGLKSDRLGDAMVFFALSEGQAHHLLCDCHYADTVTPAMIAARVRAVAQRLTIGEIWDKLRRAIMRVR